MSLFPDLRIAAFMIPVVLGVVCAGSPSSPRKTVYGIVKVNGVIRRIDGRDYQLVAVSYDLSLINSIGNAPTEFVWLVDGVWWKEMSRPVAKEDRLDGELNGCIDVSWMKLPDSGKLEILWGTILNPGNDAQETRRRLLSAFQPYSVDVAKIPTVHVKTNQELTSKMKELGIIPGPK
jgi:hypothetical protein